MWEQFTTDLHVPLRHRHGTTDVCLSRVESLRTSQSQRQKYLSFCIALVTLKMCSRATIGKMNHAICGTGGRSARLQECERRHDTTVPMHAGTKDSPG